MAKKTTNYGLTKPLPEEFYDVQVQNNNMDIIDAELKKRATLGTNGKVPAEQLPSMDYVPTTRTVNGKALDSNIALTSTDVGLGNVPNVSTNNQTPTFTTASQLATLTSGEKLSVSMGKIMRAITDLISHIGNKNNPHSVTAEQVNAAPAGFGLGTTAVKAPETANEDGTKSSDANTIIGTGFYRAIKNVPNGGWHYILHICYTSTAALQIAIPAFSTTDNNPRALHHRVMYGGVWSEWTDNLNELNFASYVTPDAIGARPDTWMPTAADVGARPNTWMPTAAQVGAAPAGFGLGTRIEMAPLRNPDATSSADADLITGTGFYQAFQNTSGSGWNYVIHLDYSSSGHALQIAVSASIDKNNTPKPLAYRVQVNGVWTKYVKILNELNFASYVTPDAIGAAQIETGSYVGTGSTEKTLTFSFDPSLVIITGAKQHSPLILGTGTDRAATIGDSHWHYVTHTFAEKSVTFQFGGGSGTVSNATKYDVVHNVAETTYSYTAIG